MFDRTKQDFFLFDTPDVDMIKLLIGNAIEQLSDVGVEKKDIVVLWCFTEQRRYTVYDYINLIIVRQWKKYSSVYDYLIRHLGEQKFNEFYSLVEQGIQLEEESLLEQTIEYIDNLYNEHDNVIDFINCLYLEKE